MRTMPQSEMVRFFKKMETTLGVKYISKNQWYSVTKILLQLIRSKYSGFIPDLSDAVRPFAAKNLNVLTFNPGDASMPQLEQIDIAVHEAQHSLDIRRHPASVANWYACYFKNQHFRAYCEGNSNTAAAEVRHYLTGNYPHPVCDYAAYRITDAGAMRNFEQGCDLRRNIVLTHAAERPVTQGAARAAIKILRDMGVTDERH